MWWVQLPWTKSGFENIHFDQPKSRANQVLHLLRKLFNQKFNMLTSSEQEGLTKCFPQKTSKLQLKWGCTKTLLTPQKTHPAALHLEMQELSGWDLKWLQFITPQQIHCTTQPDGT